MAKKKAAPRKAASREAASPLAAAIERRWSEIQHLASEIDALETRREEARLAALALRRECEAKHAELLALVREVDNPQLTLPLEAEPAAEAEAVAADEPVDADATETPDPAGEVDWFGQPIATLPRMPKAFLAVCAERRLHRRSDLLPWIQEGAPTTDADTGSPDGLPIDGAARNRLLGYYAEEGIDVPA